MTKRLHHTITWLTSPLVWVLVSHCHGDIVVAVRSPDQSKFGLPVLIEAVQGPRATDDPAISADGLVLLFASSRDGGAGGEDLWVSTRATLTSPWDEPAPLPLPPNSAFTDKAPALSSDASTLFFSSDRPGGFGGGDLWTAVRNGPGDPWSTPVLLAELNSADSDGTPALRGDGLEIFFRSDRNTGGRHELFVSRRSTLASPWSPPTYVPGLRHTAEQAGPHPAADGERVYFERRENGNGDLYVAIRNSDTGVYDVVYALSELNTNFDESDPSLTEDERIIVFTSNRSGTQEVYEARR